MIFAGTAHKFGDDINTDYIIPARRKRDTIDHAELARYLMEDISPGFPDRVRPGDFIVAGHNFGCGSSREAAPLVIKAAGIAGVIAKSFARIFYRNAINVGLIALECDTDLIQDGDLISVDLSSGTISRGDLQIKAQPLPKVMLDILKAGGLLDYLRERRDFITT
ncbi:MAG TPA: 3-isopropylmalate dehydratase small subunit [Firmicutes bacterium]|nr:3-isopropylmalate dehydratase small subunit [Bacillota bacterium]